MQSEILNSLQFIEFNRQDGGLGMQIVIVLSVVEIMFVYKWL